MTKPPAEQDDNPFAPGPGITPEHIVGRKQEFKLLGRALQGIVPRKIKEGRLKRASMGPVVLTGPRGVGKTLLLGWMEEQAREMGIHVARLEYVKDLAAGDALGNLFDEIAGGDESLLQLVKGFNLSVGPLGGGVDLGAATRTYKNVLQSRLRQGPLVLLMDEAHHYQAKYMGLMLQVGQRLINQRYPLVMLLAGTPDLRSYLMNIEATFMARSKRIYINLLTTEESKDALKKPFTNRGIKVDPEALEMMWGMTDNYPFFVQLVGSEVWEVLPQGKKRRINVALVEKAKAGISRGRSDFYSLIYDEMDDGDLTAYALQAAETINRQADAKVEREVIEQDLRQKHSDLDAKKARKIVNRLQWLGFIWGLYTILAKSSSRFYRHLHHLGTRSEHRQARQTPRPKPIA